MNGIQSTTWNFWKTWKSWCALMECTQNKYPRKCFLMIRMTLVEFGSLWNEEFIHAAGVFEKLSTRSKEHYRFAYHIFPIISINKSTETKVIEWFHMTQLSFFYNKIIFTSMWMWANVSKLELKRSLSFYVPNIIHINDTKLLSWKLSMIL